MKKILSFVLLLSYTASLVAAENSEAERYSSLNEGVLNYLASSRSLQAFARRRRGELPRSEPNAYTHLFNHA